MTTSAQRRQVLFSTDGHAGADILDYKPYLESTYHDAFDTWAANYSRCLGRGHRPGPRTQPPRRGGLGSGICELGRQGAPCAP